MRVLIVQSGFGAGGAERVISMLSGHFADSGINVHVTAFSMPDGGPYFDMHPQVEISSMQGPNGQHRRITHIRRTVREFQPDVVISFLTKVNVLTLIATIGLSVPVVISERNNPRLQKAHPLWNHLQGFLGAKASRMVAQTQAVLDNMQPSLRRRGVVIPNPVRPLKRSEQSAPDEPCRLVSVGRLDHQKGFDMLLDSMRQIHDACPTATLTIYGEGPERAALEAQRDALELGAVVDLPGGTSKAGEWAQHTDIVLAPSRYEGLPNVLAEAAVSGIPAVAFDCEFGPSEILENGKTGFVVPLGDVSGFAEATIKLIQNPDLRMSMASASVGIRERLSPENVFSQWDKLIAEVRR